MTKTMGNLIHARPTQYPIPYYLSSNFMSLPRISTTPSEIDENNVKIISSAPIWKSYLLNTLNVIKTDIVGILRGEYFVVENGLLMVDRNGSWYFMNWSLDNQLFANRPFEIINQPGSTELRNNILSVWDDIPIVENALLMASIWEKNYYHFTFDLVPKLRLAQPANFKDVFICDSLLTYKFQKSLLIKTLGSNRVYTGCGMRVRDPVIAECVQSRESLLWLRDKMNINVPSGHRRILIRRNQSKPRVGNNIAITQEFLDVLNRYNFEVVDFGAGDKSIEEQIDMLSGAELILSPHGAGLTNLVYLNPPLTLIELFSVAVLSSSFIQICAHLGFRYYGIIEEDVCSDLDIPVNVGELDRILRECLG